MVQLLMDSGVNGHLGVSVLSPVVGEEPGLVTLLLLVMEELTVDPPEYKINCARMRMAVVSRKNYTLSLLQGLQCRLCVV